MHENVIKVKLSDGAICLFEVTPSSGREEVSAIDDVFEFTEVRNQISQLSEQLLGIFKEIGPTKAALEFGIELSAESGKLTSLIVKGAAKANIKVTLEWEKKAGE